MPRANEYKILVEDHDGRPLGYVERVELNLVEGWEYSSYWDAAYQFDEADKNEFIEKTKPPRSWVDGEAKHGRFIPIAVDEDGRELEPDPIVESWPYG